MTKRNIIIGIIILLAIIAFAAYSFFQSLTTFPTSEEAEVSFQTIASSRPEGSGCLNQAGEAGLAKELINMRERIVVVGGRGNKMPDSEWPDYEPSFRGRKTLTDIRCSMTVVFTVPQLRLSIAKEGNVG